MAFFLVIMSNNSYCLQRSLQSSENKKVYVVFFKILDILTKKNHFALSHEAWIGVSVDEEAKTFEFPAKTETEVVVVRQNSGRGLTWPSL